VKRYFIGKFQIKSIKKRKNKIIFTLELKEKNLKLKAVSELFDNMPLYRAFDKNEYIKLKLKITRKSIKIFKIK
jgi:hypothetical protein